MRGLPVVLHVAGRPIVVVGAGSVASRRLASALEAGAEVVVIAPLVSAAVAAAAEASGGRCRIEQRSVTATDVVGTALVLCCVDDADVDDAVVRWCLDAGVPVASARAHPAATASLPASVTVDRVRISVSTDPPVPSLARHLAEQAAGNLPVGIDTVVVVLAEVRSEVMSSGRSVNGAVWQELVVAGIMSAESGADRAVVKERLRACLSSS